MKLVLPAVMVLAAGAAAHAFEFRVRFTERIGNVDVVIDNNYLFSNIGEAHRVRVQFGVFDDATSAAPAGGFVGWNVGTIDVGGAPSPTVTRTPGRAGVFTFSTHPNANGNPPLPGGDPFLHLTEIDATQGTQSPAWNCDPTGNPLAQPAATVRGRNTFVSVYEITIVPGFGIYDLAYAGNLIAATEWRAIGTPIPPDCGDPSNPMDDIPGAVTYAPFPTDPVAFAAMLIVDTTPTPGAASLLVVGGAFGCRRRRR